MSNWVQHPVILKGDIVELHPMEPEHFDTLRELSKNPRIWEFYSVDLKNPDRFNWWLQNGINEREKGRQYPFIIFHKPTGQLIGGTRLLNIDPENKKLEIGSTWLIPDYWATAVNLECKLLILTFCFETLGTLRVQLVTDETNIRSRKAIEKIGAKFEGVLRNFVIRDNGTNRNTAFFSIIADEWSLVKPELENKFLYKKM